MRPEVLRLSARTAGVVLAALLLVAALAQTTLYPRLVWWFQDSTHRFLNAALPMDHVLAVDVDDESIRRLEPQLGAWPYSRDVYARVARFLSASGARAVAFDVLFSESRAGDDPFASSLNRRSVLAAAAVPESADRSPDYGERLETAALFDRETARRSGASMQVWPGLALPLAKLTRHSGARTGVITVVADADGIVRGAALLHEVRAHVLPSLALAALMASDPGAQPRISESTLRLGGRAWPVDERGLTPLRYPGNATAVPVIPFFELLAAEAGVQGTAHIAESARGKIVFVGSSAAVLGDFALTPAGRIPGLNLNALFTELLLADRVLRLNIWWLDALLVLLALAFPAVTVVRDTAARPGEFLWGFTGIGVLGTCSGLALLSIGQCSGWLFATLAGLVAEGLALSLWLFALYQEKQRLFYEKFAAQEASRLKTEFLSYMTHELRTPITAIMGFNKINQFSDDMGREQRVRNSEIVARNCEHLLALVNNNLNLARIEAGQLSIERRPENLRGLLEDVVSTMRIMAEEKGLRLHLIQDPRMPTGVLLDPLRVRGILINLVGNAVKFTEQGEVTLDVRWEEGALEVRVRDTGVGIPANELSRVFEPFQRVAGTQAGGTGLGLTITKKLVELMGGTVNVRSVRGEGTDFTVSIPAPPVDLPEPKETRPRLPPAPLPGGRVLAAEDVEHLRSLIELYLRKLGLECTTVGNGFEAVETAFAGDFDVVLLDMEMPVMDGFEAARVLRERGYDKPIVALTGHSDDVELERATREGCDAVLSKPVTLEQLRSTLQPLLAARAGTQPGKFEAKGAQR